MHQTFYIDIDEEISAVIERLKKSVAKENYFVVPKRAIFLQSIVNLKLLKRESEKMGKYAILITQDAIGTNMAEKAGILVRSSLDGIEQPDSREDELIIAEAYPSQTEEGDAENSSSVDDSNRNQRLEMIGSDDFYGPGAAPCQSEPQMNMSPRASMLAQRRQAHETKRQVQTTAPARAMDARARTHYIKLQPANVEPSKMTEPGLVPSTAAKNVANSRLVVPNKTYGEKLDPKKEKRLEMMYSHSQENHAEAEIIPIAGKTRKFAAAFILLCTIIPASVGAYLFLPSANIVVSAVADSNKMDMDMIAQVQAEENFSEAVIKVSSRLAEVNDTVNASYEATGTADKSGQKARGSVVIYNEFDTNPQALIATTRLKSQGGKIFRLVKGVTVPSMTKVGSEWKAGAITAEVVADEAGDDFNISADTFSIPGFAGSAKFEKFYAKSTEAMSGGLSGDGVRSVSQTDLDNAKKATDAILKQKLNQALAMEVKEGEKLLDNISTFSITDSKPLARSGDVKDSFDYASSGTASALIFSEKELEDAVKRAYVAKNPQKQVKINKIKLDYAGVTADMETKTLSAKVYAQITESLPLVADELRVKLLGKDESGVREVMKEYDGAIKNVSFEFWPSFVSRIPQYPSRVRLSIEDAGE